ncbi:prolyl 3-hydroxylase 1-like [Bombina bombina]|uniref:prolyl 3-hydroxylase 1-like n=1 Tax=Bombina bombina TaxID=8345 RepID=UPI00235AEBB8|nr:prolyl 3-hydroxylase 1-like [Bombina bombina]
MTFDWEDTTHRMQVVNLLMNLRQTMEEFRLGVGYYTDEEQGTSIIHFEKALEEYFAADQECRALCEGPYDYDGYNYMDYTADLFLSITGALKMTT